MVYEKTYTDVEFINDHNDFLTLHASSSSFTITHTVLFPSQVNRLAKLYYSLDNGATWQDFHLSKTASDRITVTVRSYHDIMFKGSDGYLADVKEGGLAGVKFIISNSSSFPVKIEGSIMSLIDGCGLTKKIKAPCCFYGLFDGQDVELGYTFKMPATTLSRSCYQLMFRGTSVATLDKNLLPATTLASGCYMDMFADCFSLTLIPDLPATTLADACYQTMFANCIKLTYIGYSYALPATEAKNYCYYMMFAQTNISLMPNIALQSSAPCCCYAMFLGDVNNYPKFTSARLYLEEVEGSVCLCQMFRGCANLNRIQVGFSEWVGTDSNCSTYLWVEGVSNTGTFIKGPNLPDRRGANYIPVNWT